MQPVVVQTIKSRWFAGCVHAGLWLLLCLALADLNGKAPGLREKPGPAAARQYPEALDKIEHLFASESWPKPLAATNAFDGFATRHFIPQAAPPPTTKKIELVYHGYLTVRGQTHAFVKFGTNYLVTPVGGKLIANLFAACANGRTLTLTNPAAQTNLLPLNIKKEIEVPIQ